MITCVALMQPYLLPALPYLQLAHAADVFVFYDDASFSHGRWTHRNRVEVAGAPHLFTVPLANRGPDRALNAISLDSRGYDRWRRKFIATVRQAYARAPNVDTVLPKLEALLAAEHHTLANLAEASVRWLADAFGIAPRWSRASAIDYDRGASAQDKVLEIAASVDASAYINMPGGRALYDSAAFAVRGVRLGFMRDLTKGDDALGLSALHLLMHRSRSKLAALAAEHEIEWTQE